MKFASDQDLELRHTVNIEYAAAEKGYRCVSKGTALLALLLLVTSWYFAQSLVSMSRIGARQGAPNDFFQLWNAARALLQGSDPYGPEVTLRAQIAMYGMPAKAVDGQVYSVAFAYPLQGAFPALPLALMSFPIADKVALITFALIIALSVGWLRGCWDSTALLYCILAFASYPVIIALQMRQPTVLFFGLAIASLALLRSNHLVLAGVVGALAAGKPQIAVAVLLPMLVWALAEWKTRNRFPISLAVSSLHFSPFLALLGRAG